MYGLKLRQKIPISMFLTTFDHASPCGFPTPNNDLAVYIVRNYNRLHTHDMSQGDHHYRPTMQSMHLDLVPHGCKVASNEQIFAF